MSAMLCPKRAGPPCMFEMDAIFLHVAGEVSGNPKFQASYEQARSGAAFSNLLVI